MKKILFLLIVCGSCLNNMTFAQVGEAAKAGAEDGSSGFAWSIGLGAAAVIGTLVWVIVAKSSSSPENGQSHSH